MSLESKVNPGYRHGYVVTNQHVIDTAGCPVVRAVSHTSKVRIWDLSPSDWIPHPERDDVAVCYLNLWDEPEMFTSVDVDSFFLDFERMADLEIGVGDDVFMVSGLQNYDGGERNEPIMRFGSLALGKPIEVEQRERSRCQESFIVEMRSVSGHSGSPVFVWLPSHTTRVRRPATARSEMRLLGIDWGHMDPKYGAIANVVPCWKIWEVIDMEFEKQRRVADEAERKRRQSAPLAVMDSNGPQFTKEDFESALKKASRRVTPLKSDEENS